MDGESVAIGTTARDAGGRAPTVGALGDAGAVAEGTGATDCHGWRPRLLQAILGISSIHGGQKCWSRRERLQ